MSGSPPRTRETPTTPPAPRAQPPPSGNIVSFARDGNMWEFQQQYVRLGHDAQERLLGKVLRTYGMQDALVVSEAALVLFERSNLLEAVTRHCLVTFNADYDDAQCERIISSIPALRSNSVVTELSNTVQNGPTVDIRRMAEQRLSKVLDAMKHDAFQALTLLSQTNPSGLSAPLSIRVLKYAGLGKENLPRTKEWKVFNENIRGPLDLFEEQHRPPANVSHVVRALGLVFKMGYGQV